ncbi:hypothetical protein PC41400_14910 [Paenibacillus chitinolyticus]|uniref:Uncharacterized protein n=1 Tax=Paenibacillus chitinolyticus TaxID=79263 RepID=A0A410WWV9_9BACL|nr:hypothetical protein [Paenibacillus chitinolyticus]MCY9592366.1 hypothetical protein [Paenibacillus chitinolyticus]MCY9599827.1 hypothetical protein [Paenibacillus chitinolyticus]QAV18898.1 hypothetical protein PC41400_14910 [Paenibacillus chitinolyticus]
MGTDRSDYIIIGCDVKQLVDKMDEEGKDNFYDGYYRWNRRNGEIVHLPDNNSGDYDYFGVIVEHDPDGYEGLSPFIYEENRYAEHKEKVTKAIKEVFDVELEPKLIVLTHWQ